MGNKFSTTRPKRTARLKHSKVKAKDAMSDKKLQAQLIQGPGSKDTIRK